MTDKVQRFIDSLQKDDEGHVLHTSFLESNLRCSAPLFERKPKKVRYVNNRDNWPGITIFTDKMLHLAPQVKSAIKVAWLIEPYDLLPQIYEIIPRLEEHYDLILTYEKSLIDKNPQKYKFHPCDTSGIEKHSHKIHKKTKLVSMIYSEKTWLFGHRLRHIIAKTLLPQMGYDKVDLFGRGTDHPLELKSKGTNDYMFQIAIENAQRENYFADKIYDCFVTGTIPIYWGAPNVIDFFDERGILMFETPEQLKEILFGLSEEKYYSMLDYVKINFDRVQKYLEPDDLLYDNIVKHLKERSASALSQENI